jgi:hypothetical protein
MTATIASLIDHLREQGYDPDVSGAVDRFDLVVSGIGSVRVRMYPDDGYSADVSVLDATMAEEWQATFCPNTPDAAILGVIEAAEWQLAAKRGGPVTPAQEEIAR